MASNMKAVAIDGGKGPASALHITTIPIPTPKPNEALVRIKAFGLNRMDLLQREGQYAVPPQAPPTLGVEFSGVIVQPATASAPPGSSTAGSNSGSSSNSNSSTTFAKGDAVFGLAYGGAYAEYIAVSTTMLIHKPSSLSWEEAAGIPEAWITATQALYLVGGFSSGKSVLFHAGASAVSIAGMQLARAEGAKAVYATAGADAKCEFVVKELGATKAFNYKNETGGGWSKAVQEATGGKGVDLIVDYVGGTYFQGNLDAAGLDGTVVMLGFLGGVKTPEQVNLGPMLKKRLRVQGSTLRSRDEKYQGKLRDMLVEHAMPKFEKKEFKLFIEKVFPWEEVQKAHELMESNQTKGKLICTIAWDE